MIALPDDSAVFAGRVPHLTAVIAAAVCAVDSAGKAEPAILRPTRSLDGLFITLSKLILYKVVLFLGDDSRVGVLFLW